MMSKRRSTDIWHLVQFIEDSIWYICPPTKIKSISNGYLVRWNDGKWYPANLYKTGDKESMKKIKEQKESDTDANVLKDNGMCNEENTKKNKKTRRMCNVKLDMSDDELTGKMESDFCSRIRYYPDIDNSKIDLNKNVAELINLGGEPDFEAKTCTHADQVFTNTDKPVNSLTTAEESDITSPKENCGNSKKSEVFLSENSEEIQALTPRDKTTIAIDDVSSKTNNVLTTIDQQSPKVVTELLNVFLTPCQEAIKREESTSKLSDITNIYNKRKRCCKSDVCYMEETEENVFEEEDTSYEPSTSFSNKEFSSDFDPSFESNNQSLQIPKNEPPIDPMIFQKSFVPENVQETELNVFISQTIPESQIDVTNNADVSTVCENVTHYPSLQIAAISSTTERKWDKKFFCPFCQKLYCKLPRHMYNCHSNEKEVAIILSLPKNSQDRKILIQELENRGTFLRNKMTIKEGEGIIMPKRRIHREHKKCLEDYAPCTYCFQMYSKTYLYRHVKQCTFNKENNEDSKTTKNRSILANSILMLPVGPGVSDKFRESILCKMSGDRVFTIIRTDQLILLFGETEFKRLGHDKRYHRNIIDRCRELGRLVHSAKELDQNVNSLKSLIHPSKYKLFRDAVFKVAGYNAESNTFKTPSLALKIGYTIKKCISVLKGEYLEDEILRTDIPNLDTFMQILDSKWHIEVTSHAHRTLAERKWNAPKRIPLTKDIQILHKYLSKERDKCFTELRKQPSVEAFKTLTEVTLVLVIILNRRRVGDVQYTPLDIYQKAEGIDSESDVFETLSETEKQLAKCFKRLVIRGKRGRGVPILLTNEIQESIDLLISRRAACGLDMSNNYLFPSLRNTCGFYRASDLITSFAKKAGCEMAHTITSTRLRKHVSTMVQLLNLKDHELDALAQFLGHDIRVHRKHYRLQDETVQLAKISKILVNFNSGKLNSMKGKSLDEIEVSDFSESELDNDKQDREDSEDLMWASVKKEITR